jgi:hypothetical protein
LSILSYSVDRSHRCFIISLNSHSSINNIRQSDMIETNNTIRMGHNSILTSQPINQAYCKPQQTHYYLILAYLVQPSSHLDTLEQIYNSSGHIIDRTDTISLLGSYYPQSIVICFFHPSMISLTNHYYLSNRILQSDVSL